MLQTPEKIREFQRKLYRKAKREKAYRFYALYDKVYREDILKQAWERVKANGGSPGTDGVTIADVVEQIGEERFLKETATALKEETYRPAPIRRVYIPKSNGKKRPLGIPTLTDRTVQAAVMIVIEPIFEADFEGCSYGFRPKRSAWQALEEIKRAVNEGKTEVFDADISSYFDAIPHAELMEKVAKRTVDRRILRLIHDWLKAPIVEEGDDGKDRWSGGSKNRVGTPQGGVISPLLANLYLHTLDQAWKEGKLGAEGETRLVRYADDFVVMTRPGQATAVGGRVKGIVGALKLSLNEKKTRVVDGAKEWLIFLGYEVKKVRDGRTHREYVRIQPSRESQKEIRAKIGNHLGRSDRRNTAEVIEQINRTVRGWINYFRYGDSRSAMETLRYYMGNAIRRFLQRRAHLRGYGWSQYPERSFWREVGLIDPRKILRLHHEPANA